MPSPDIFSKRHGTKNEEGGIEYEKENERAVIGKGRVARSVNVGALRKVFEMGQAGGRRKGES